MNSAPRDRARSKDRRKKGEPFLLPRRKNSRIKHSLEKNVDFCLKEEDSRGNPYISLLYEKDYLLLLADFVFISMTTQEREVPPITAQGTASSSDIRPPAGWHDGVDIPSEPGFRTRTIQKPITSMMRIGFGTPEVYHWQNRVKSPIRLLPQNVHHIPFRQEGGDQDNFTLMIYTHNLGVNNIFISRGEKLLICTKHEFTGERVADLEPDITQPTTTTAFFGLSEPADFFALSWHSPPDPFPREEPVPRNGRFFH